MPRLQLLLLLLLCLQTTASPDQSELTFEDYYQAGKERYTDGQWDQCIAFMRRAIEDFRYVEDELVFCRKMCASRIEAPDETEVQQRFATAQKALCVLRCKRDRFTERHPGIRKMSTVFDLMERKPYEYLHFCYFRAGELSQAVKSAYTYVTRNPGDSDVARSLNYYMEQPGYDDSMLVDAERSRFETHFIDGVRAYDNSDWSDCNHHLELALEGLLEQDQRCRWLCEDKIDWSVVNGNPELDVLVTSMKTTVLRCQHSCLFRSSRVNGHDIGHPIAAILEYQHFCQYKMLRGVDAMQSVANYLLFDENPFMRRNRYFYAKQYENSEKFFKPSQKMAGIFNQREIEERFLNYVDSKFKLVNNDFPAEHVEDRVRPSSEVEIEDKFPYDSIGSLLSSSECQILRSPFPVSFHDSLTASIETRVRSFFSGAKFSSVTCGGFRQSDCEKALILSVESADCSEWLGSFFSGCSIQFCV